LARPKNQAELQTLVAALADEDDNIRWLASSALVRLGGLPVVKLLAAFLQSDPGETARQEALKVLGLIGDTSEDTAVREAAGQVAGG
jgi:HEAT repeat protein